MYFQSTRKELYEKYKSLWQTLSESKKLRYIRMAIEAKKKYDVRLAFAFFLQMQNFANIGVRGGGLEDCSPPKAWKLEIWKKIIGFIF